MEMDLIMLWKALSSAVSEVLIALSCLLAAIVSPMMADAVEGVGVEVADNYLKQIESELCCAELEKLNLMELSPLTRILANIQRWS